jgi:hypothetical protein
MILSPFLGLYSALKILGIVRKNGRFSALLPPPRICALHFLLALIITTVIIAKTCTGVPQRVPQAGGRGLFELGYSYTGLWQKNRGFIPGPLVKMERCSPKPYAQYIIVASLHKKRVEE